MSQLTWSSIPGPFDLANSAIAADQPLTDDSIQKISANAKFGAVRCEIIYMGFWANGGTIPTPVSPVDGYNYSRSEVMYIWSIYSNRSPGSGFVQGQATPPAQSNSQPQNGLYNFPGEWDINDSTGEVSLRTSYYSGGGSEVVTNDGIIKVWAICQRNSVNTAN
ncbi:MAG TPA: hypothetical protein VKW70_00050 [Terriglobia bacterium]|nr:hypothetical protein [Terriglobia bacterium]